MALLISYQVIPLVIIEGRLFISYAEVMKNLHQTCPNERSSCRCHSSQLLSAGIAISKGAGRGATHPLMVRWLADFWAELLANGFTTSITAA